MNYSSLKSFDHLLLAFLRKIS